MLRGITIPGPRALSMLLTAAVFFVITTLLSLLPSWFNPVSAQASLSITKSASPEPVYTGNTLTYTIIIANVGSSPAYDVTVFDTITAFSNPEYRITTSGDWNAWTGSYDFGTVSNAVPYTRTLYIRGQIALNQCTNVSNTAWVSHQAGSDTISASVESTVLDNQLPVINCPADITIPTSGVYCYGFPTIIPATATDNCGMASLAGVRSDGFVLSDPYPVGITLITWTATDLSGNINTCIQTIEILDEEFPVIDCPDDIITNTNNGLCAATVTTPNPVFSDNCEIVKLEWLLLGATTGASPTTGINYLGTHNFNPGLTMVTYRVEDGSGNKSICTFYITVEDNVNPVINCPDDQIVNTGPGICTYTHLNNSWNATGSDNCIVASIAYELNGSTTGSGTSLNGSTFNHGITTVTWTITDGNGNTSQCSFTVTVLDNQNPTIVCSGNQSAATDVGVCTYTHIGAAWDATGSDNCTNVSIVYTLSGATIGSGSSLNGVIFNIGLTNVNWTVTDSSGNFVQCNRTITVTDNEYPIINCQANQAANTDPGTCTYTHSGTAWNATGSDNCNISSISYILSGATTGTGTTLDGATFNAGNTTVTWTITDGSGNTAQCSHTITITDTEDPTINCAGDQAVNTDPGICTYTHNGTSWNATGTDNCSIASITYSLSGATTGTGASLNGVAFNLGITIITWTITDGAGNTAQCNHTITVTDAENPVISCNGNHTVSTNPGTCSYTHNGTAWNATGSDNCSVSSIIYMLSGATTGTGTTLNGVAFNLGITTATWTITDGNGNTAQCSHTITVTDNENPIINCAGNQSVSTDPGACTYTHSGTNWDATGSDNCSVANIIYVLSGSSSGSGTTLNGVTFNLGITTATWTITDGNGNTAQCSHTITVTDNENPIINCAGNQSVSTDPGTCTYTHSGTNWDATGSDNCSVANIIYVLSGSSSGSGTTLNGVTFSQGITTATWTITDGNGNTAQCSHTITVTDNENPIINCAGNQSVSTDPGACSYTHSGTGWDATGSDNCSVANIIYVLSGSSSGSGTSLNGVTYNLGITTATWTITDGNGNTAQCSHTITVTDNENPIINCAGNQSVSTDPGACTYTHSGTNWDATGSDNCGVANIIYVLSGSSSGSGTTLNGVTFSQGITTATWTITDGNGNTAQCSHTITVTDNENPIINCAGNQSVSTDPGACSYTHSGTGWDATGSDNCSVANIIYVLSGSSSGSGTTLNGVTFSQGITTATWTITDGNGNTAQCSHTITVTDNENPIINCAGNQSASTDPGTCTYTHSGTNWDATGSDNCSVANIIYVLSGSSSGSGTTLNGVTFNQGITTATWTITDGNGNTAQCSHTITVTDNENPIINCAGNQSVSTDPGACTYTHSGTNWDATGSDNCGVSSISYSLSGATTGTGASLNGVAFNLGTTTATWTITDNNGNTATCSHTITVEDNENPTITCPGDQTVSTDPGTDTYTHNGTSWNATGSDNCSVSSITYTLSGATTGTGTTLDVVTFNLGITTVTWTITDGSGNTATCSHTITVEDNEVPTITCAGNQIRNTDAGTCTYTHNGTDWDATGSDNSGVSSIIYIFSGATTGTGTSLNGVTFNLGTTIATWTITDNSGNTASCSHTITVEDNEVPTILCAGDQTTNTDPGICTYTHSGISWNATGSDNCGVNSIIYTLSGASTGTGITLNGATFNLGTTLATWTITDNSGNTAICSHTITVVDVEVPTISCAGNQTVDTDPGTCTYTHNGTAWNATGTDNCSVNAITYVLTGATTGTGTTLAGVTFNPGVTTITWTITDGSGNTATCSHTVTVADNEDPIINCIGNQTVNTNPGVCTYTHSGAGWNATGSDNCTVSSIIYVLTGVTNGTGTTLSGVIFNLGITTVTWTITDSSGNTASCSYTVTVVDNELPTINCVNNQTVSADAGVCFYTHYGTAWNAIGGDNCSVASIAYVLTGVTTGTGTTLNLVTFNLGTTTVTWTVTDGIGNTAVCSFNVIVQDNEPPVIVCPADLTVFITTEYSTENYIYAFRGNISADFLRYSIEANTWEYMAPAPNPISGGGALVFDGDNTIYALRGNGTNHFWKYNIETNTWSVLSNTPQVVNSGGALALAGTNHIYALRGASTNNFWSYNIDLNTWTTLTNTPSAVERGGALSSTGDNFIYALRGNTQTTFWRYNITTNAWQARQATPATVRGGGSLVYPGGDYLYALRGNTQTAFWRYHLANNAWQAMQNTPSTVNDGGALTTNGERLFAFRGNNTNTFWSYNVFSNSWNAIQNAPANVQNGGSMVFVPITIAVEGCEYVLAPGELGSPSTNDNCPPVASVTNNAPAILPVGITQVTWTVTDQSGNTSTCIQNVSVVDLIPPKLHGIPADTLYLCQPLPPPPVIGVDIYATDNCDNNVTITYSQVSTQVFDGSCASVIYQIFRTWVATDDYGNTDTAVQVIDILCECCTNGIDDTGNGLIDEEDPYCPCSAPQFKIQCEITNYYFIPTIWQMNPNFNGNPNIYTNPSSFVLTSPFGTANVNVRTGDGTTYNQNFQVTQGAAVEVPLNWNLVQTPNYNVAEINRGFVIESDLLIQVIYRLEATNNKNLITIKGEQALGRRFRAGSQSNVCGAPDTQKRENHYISVMAIEDNTQVTFTFTAAMKGLPQVHTVTLNEFETYLVIDNDNNQTVTGTLIVATKDIAVISGNQHSARTCYPGQDGRDGDGDQLVSSCVVGTDYVVFRGIDSYNPSNSNYAVITPVAAATQVFINGSATPVATLDPGEYYTYNMPGPNGSNHYIRTSHESYCYQYGSVQSNGEIGMAIAAPIYGCNGDKYIEFLKFPNSTTNTLTIVIINSGLASLRLNDVHYSAYTTANTIPGLPSHKTVTFNNNILANYNVVESDEYFHAAQFVGNVAGGTFGYLTSFKDKVDVFHPETLQPTVQYLVDTICGGETYEHCLTAHSCAGDHYISNIIQGDNTGGLTIYPNSVCFSYTGLMGFHGIDSIVVMVSDQLGFTQPVCLSFYVCGLPPVLIPPPGATIDYNCHDEIPEPFSTLEEFLAAGGIVYTICDTIVVESFAFAGEVSNNENCPETITRTYQIENECGHVGTCEQIIIIHDTIPPTFSLPADTIYCVEDLIDALYNPVGIYPIDDLTYPRPDYYLHLPGNTILDLIDLDDNCTVPEDLIIEWQIDFGNNGSIDETGTGQLSEPPPIYFPVGINTIHFTVTDECGNSTSQTLIMVVRPRPDIQDDF